MQLEIRELNNLILIIANVGGRAIDLGTYTKAEAVKVWEDLQDAEEALSNFIRGS